MAGERHPSSDYLWSRQVAALALIGVVVVILVLDVLVDQYEVSTAVPREVDGKGEHEDGDEIRAGEQVVVHAGDSSGLAGCP